METYNRLTNQEWSKDIDLKKELRYSHIYKKLYELENKLKNGELVSKDWHDKQILYAEYTIKKLKEDKSIIIKGFVDRLKEHTHNYYPSIDYYCCAEKAVSIKDMNKVLKEYI